MRSLFLAEAGKRTLFTLLILAVPEVRWSIKIIQYVSKVFFSSFHIPFHMDLDCKPGSRRWAVKLACYDMKGRFIFCYKTPLWKYKKVYFELNSLFYRKLN